MNITREAFDRWLTLRKVIAIEAALLVFWLWFMRLSVGAWPWG